MKKIIYFVAIFSLLICGQTMAAEQSFNSSVGKFIIDVPEGWTTQAIPEGCKITSKDDKNILSIQLFPEKKIDAHSIARDLATELNMTVKESTNLEAGVWLKGNMMETQAGILTEKINSIIAVSVYTGPDFDTMKQICDSGYMEQDIKYLRLEAGPIVDNDFAQKRCPEVLAAWLKEHPNMVAQWDGNWETTVEGEMSVCGVKTHPK